MKKIKKRIKYLLNPINHCKFLSNCVSIKIANRRKKEKHIDYMFILIIGKIVYSLMSITNRDENHCLARLPRINKLMIVYYSQMIKIFCIKCDSMKHKQKND